MTRRLGSLARRCAAALISAGVDPRRAWPAVRSVVPYVAALLAARRAATADWPIEVAPILGDRYGAAGVASGHYFHADLWAAREVLRGDFARVVDVGSRIDGYVAHVLVFREIEVLDLRPLASPVPGLRFGVADVMNTSTLPPARADCVSCLHALEHFGLGRYGDALDVAQGWRRGLAGLAQLLAPGGTLLLAVPVGRQRIEFDAHRVFSPATVIDAAAALGLTLADFSYVDDQGAFHAHAACEEANALEYGCGCFRFSRGA